MSYRWTQRDERTLQFWWGAKDLGAIATILGRTPGAVAEHARKLGLGVPSRSGKTMRELTRSSGYSLSRIRTAIERLGLKLRRARRSDPRQRRFTHDYSITFEQEQTILRFLRKHPDGQRLYKTRGRRTENGRWGVGSKPSACHECGHSDRPHFARGFCKRCYMHIYRLRKKNPWS